VEQFVSERVDVLIVDDSEDQRVLLSTYFERAGCDVRAFASAEDAMSSYRESRPDLAVIDLIMPGIDGWALATLLRTDYPTCPIAITSVLDRDQYPAGEAALPKPVTGAAVRQILRDCVPRWKAL
jgi:CheY-like chemotaxis protein